MTKKMAHQTAPFFSFPCHDLAYFAGTSFATSALTSFFTAATLAADFSAIGVVDATTLVFRVETAEVALADTLSTLASGAADAGFKAALNATAGVTVAGAVTAGTGVAVAVAAVAVVVAGVCANAAPVIKVAATKVVISLFMVISL